MSHISDPTPKKKAEVCSKTWKKAKVWSLAKCGTEVELAWESTQRLSKHSDVFLQFF